MSSMARRTRSRTSSRPPATVTRPTSGCELYAWVERELLRAPSGVAGDLPVTPEPLETLRVGLPEGNKTYYDVYREWVAAIPVPRAPGNREEVAAYAARTRPALAKKLGLPSGLEPPTVRAVRDAEAEGVRAGFYAIETEPGMTIPVAEFRPARAGPLPVVLIVGARARSRAEVESALAAGRAALVVEPRGAGEVDWGGRRTDNAAWFFGRPRVGQEAFDVLRVAERWRARRDVASISLDGDGRWGKAVLFAAALDPEIAAVADESAPDGSSPVRGGRALGPGRGARPARRRRPAADRRPHRPAPVPPARPRYWPLRLDARRLPRPRLRRPHGLGGETPLILNPLARSR